jgi:uncharacterized spore protein YtfJ
MANKSNDLQEDVKAPASNPTIQGVTSVQETMERFLAAADVGAVYGAPVEHGETMIIPAAEVLSGMGFGVGFGVSDTNPAEGEQQADQAAAGNTGGGGGGGGGRVLSRPVAVVILEPGSVRVEPVVDVTKVALAAFTAFGFMFSILTRMRAKR